MSVKHNKRESIIDALNKAQHIAFGPVLFQAVRAALNTGFLHRLAQPSSGEQEAARAVGLSDYAAGVLTDMLTAGGVLDKDENGVLTVTKTGECLLFDEMTRVNFNFTGDVCYRGMEHITDPITQGRPAGLPELGDWPTIYPAISVLPEPARTSWFAFDHYYSDRYFAQLAQEIGKTLSPTTLFDVGGNTGKFAAACLTALPKTHVTLIDLPPQCAIVQKNPVLAPFADRFATAAVDWLNPEAVPPVDRRADVIWMSQFLDCFSPDEAVSILTRCKPLLSDKGRFAVLECLVDRQSYPAATFSLAAVSLYFTAMANGNSRFYRAGDLEAVFERAGLQIETVRNDIGVSHTLYVLKAK